MAAKRMSYRPALYVAGASAASCLLIWLCWGMYLYWNDIRLLNFLAAWIPFVLSIVLAFVPDHEMTFAKKIFWRASVIGVGFLWSVVLWHQQVIVDVATHKDQQQIVTDAVRQSNQHSDEQIKSVRTDVGEVQKNVGVLESDLNKTSDKLAGIVKQSESDITAGLSKVGKPEPEIAHVVFSLWPMTKYNFPVVTGTLPVDPSNKSVTVAFTFQAQDHTARGLTIWLRCNECTYLKEPPGFLDAKNQTVPSERMLVVHDFLPNVAYAVVEFSVRLPLTYDGFRLELNYACDNCPLIDPDKPQMLTIFLDKSKLLSQSQ